MGVLEKEQKARYTPYALKTPVRKYKSVVGGRPESSSSKVSTADTSVDGVSVATSVTGETPSSRGSPIVRRSLGKGFSGSSKRERLLDLEIRRLERRRDTILKAVRYQKSNESQKIERLIVKWRGIAQMASNYLLNSMQLKIGTMGGMKEWRKESKQREIDFEVRILEEKANTITEYMDSDGFQNLSDMDKREVQIHLDSIYNLIDQKETEDLTDDGEGEEFDMQMLYRHLNLDHNLVYENKEDE